MHGPVSCNNFRFNHLNPEVRLNNSVRTAKKTRFILRMDLIINYCLDYFGLQSIYPINLIENFHVL